jgi:ABC-type Co2+ transport system permease subunit
VSHIHIPDGVLPVWLVASGWVAALALVWVASAVATRTGARRKVALLGVVSAVMLVSMSSEIVPIAYHVNLTVVAGVLLGPWLGVIAAFIVELVLALLGHGGVTVIGLNTLVIAAEIALGWALFRTLLRLAGTRHVRAAAGVATVVTLAATTALLVGIVALAGGGAAATRESGALDPATLRFGDPFAEGVFSIGTLRGDAAPALGAAAVPPRPPDASATVRRFALMVFTLGPVGWLIEALVTASALGYVARVRPSLLWPGTRASPRPPAGDETGGR